MNYEDRVTKGAVEGLIAGCTKIAMGSYVGTGTYGAEHPNTLTFPFPPKFLAVFPNNGVYRLLCIRGMEGGNASPNGHYSGTVSLTWSETAIFWHTIDSSSDATCQLNQANMQYFYIVLG